MESPDSTYQYNDALFLLKGLGVEKWVAVQYRDFDGNEVGEDKAPFGEKTPRQLDS